LSYCKKAIFLLLASGISSSSDSYERKQTTHSENCFPCYFKHLPLLLSITISSFQVFVEHFRSQYWGFKVLWAIPVIFLQTPQKSGMLSQPIAIRHSVHIPNAEGYSENDMAY